MFFYTSLTLLYLASLTIGLGSLGLLAGLVPQQNFLNAHQKRWLKALYITSPVLLVGLWGMAAYGLNVSDKILPQPEAVFAALQRLLADGTLASAALISLKRIMLGFSAAAIIGTVLGLLAGTFVVARILLTPTNSLLRYIPPTAFVALMIVYFGIGESYKYAVIFMGNIFFIFSMVVDAVDDVDNRYLEMAKISGHKKWGLLRHVIVPHTWPRLWQIWRTNLAGGWIFLVVAEITGADGGLGHLIALSQRFLRVDELFVCILAFGVIGFATDKLFDMLGRVFCRWHYLSLRKG